MARNFTEPLLRSLVAGFVFFALVLSLGHAMAGDTDSSTGGGTISQTVNPNAPRLVAFDIRNATTNASVIGNQLDILVNYNFWVTVNDTNGWSAVTNLYINLWYDAGNDTTAYNAANSAANYKVNITYTNAGSTSPSATQWALVSGNLVFTPSTGVTVYTNVANQRYSFRMTFQLHEQIHQAQRPTLSTAGYSNAFSWNGRFGAKDVSNNVNYTNKDPTTGNFYEFGVFQYTRIALSTTTWSGAAAAPGATVATNTVTVTHSSNAAYWLNVTASGDLSDGAGHTIAITNVKAVSSAGNDLSTNTTFPGTAPRTVTVRGTSTMPHAFDSAGNSQTTTVQFTIAIPLGTFAATYTTSISVTVVQRRPPTT